MSGTIEVYSQPGMGSEFRITVILSSIPTSRQKLVDLRGIRIRVKEPATLSRQQIELTLRQAGAILVSEDPQLLIAEDNLVNKKVAQQMLRRLGVRPDIAANGLEAVHMLSRRNYELILMDVQMPELDGLEATRCIRVSDSIRQPHIIAMTANALADDRQARLDAAMNDFIAKPVRLDDLRQALLRALRPKDDQSAEVSVTPTSSSR